MTTTMSAETVSTQEAMHLGIAIHRLHATRPLEVSLAVSRGQTDLDLEHRPGDYRTWPLAAIMNRR